MPPEHSIYSELILQEYFPILFLGVNILIYAKIIPSPQLYYFIHKK